MPRGVLKEAAECFSKIVGVNADKSCRGNIDRPCQTCAVGRSLQDADDLARDGGSIGRGCEGYALHARPRQLPLDVPLHHQRGAFEVACDCRFAFCFKVGDAAKDDLQRRFQSVRQVGRRGAGACNLLVARIKQRVDFACQRLNFVRKIIAEPSFATSPDTGNSAAYRRERFETDGNLHPGCRNKKRAENAE